MKKHSLILILLVLCGAVPTFAAPARKGVILRTQPDGTTLETLLHGDEFGHWVTDLEGQVLEQDVAGYWRPVTPSQTPVAVSLGASVRRAAADRMRIGARASGTRVGSPRIPVILVGFEKLPFSKTAAEFDALLNEPGYSANLATGSVLDYYRDNSFGRFTPEFEVLGPVTLDREISYYGANNSRGEDVRPEMALAHAAALLDDTVDFSRYDNDGDGAVDFILFYFAGHDEAQGAPSTSIWSHAWSVSYSSELSRDQRTFDGVELMDYFCTAELIGSQGTTMCRIGTTCHEFAHTLGLPDFYDTNYETGGDAATTYSMDLMADGCYNNNSATPPYLSAEELVEIGWWQGIPELPSREGEYSLGTLNAPGATSYAAYRIPADLNGEYFILEVRGGQAWDEYLPEGMLVYHVDQSSRRLPGGTLAYQTWEWNTVNCLASHPCCYIVPPTDPDSYEEAWNIPAREMVFPGSRGVGSYTPLFWSGDRYSFELQGIRYEDGQIRFSLKDRNTMEATGFNYILDPRDGDYAAGDLFEGILVTAAGTRAPASEVAWSLDGEPVSADGIVLGAGRHTVAAEFSTEGGSRKRVELELTVR